MSPSWDADPFRYLRNRATGKRGGYSAGGAAPLPMLPYTPYIVMLGDSQPTGSGATVPDITTNIAGYSARDAGLRAKVKAMAAPVTNQAFNGWMTYAPAYPANVAGVGLRQGAAQANMGPEVGFIEKIQALYSNDLYLLKDTLPGSFQGNRLIGTFTGSVSGGVLTTAVSGDVAPSNYITGAGIPAGTYVANGGGTAWNLGTIGSTATPAIAATGSITITKYDGGLSWKKDQSPQYSGFQKRIVGGVRQHLIDAIAAIPGTPVCVGILYWLGTNDKTDATATTEMQQNTTDFLTQLMIDVPQLSGAKIVWPRIRTGGGGATIRTAQTALKAIIPNLFLVETDNYPFSDGTTHFNITNGYREVGQDWFKVCFEGYAGV